MKIESGTFNRYVSDRGFGFIRPLHRGPDVFFHISNGTAVRWDEFGFLKFGGPFDMTKLMKDQVVSYQASDTSRGPKAERFWIPEGLEVQPNWRTVWTDTGRMHLWCLDLGVLNTFHPRTRTSLDRLSKLFEAGQIRFEHKIPKDDEDRDSPEGWLVNDDPRRLVDWEDRNIPRQMRIALLRFAADHTKTDADLSAALAEVGCHGAAIASHRSDLGSMVTIMAHAPNGDTVQI